MKNKSKNLLNKTRIYTIGHMEYADGRDWREYVKIELQPRGITVFNPYFKPFICETLETEEARKELKSNMDNGRFELVNKRMKAVRADDLRLCDISDFFIANIIPHVASWGSAEEITTANRAKKPIFVCVEGGKKKCPLWIMGMLPHKYIHDSVEDAVEMIKDIDAGKLRIDSERWRLLKFEYR
jgi:hypothetical protein